MTETIRLTAAQAAIRYIANQVTEDGEPIIAGCWAIFGHGNVVGLGEALYGERRRLPTYRGHCEQTMAHTAIAYAKQSRRRRAMMVTSSIGPGATNMVTAAALAHTNRLPVLLIPGDVFASRAPDPVLQQVEDFQDGTVSANDCFRPVSRYYDRIARPEQIMTALPRAFRVMTDPAECGPVTLAFCQDTQGEAYDYPVSFFERRVWRIRRPEADIDDLAAAADAIRAAKKPMIIAGGGIHYSLATETFERFVEKHRIPVAETQAGKSALPWDHPNNFGPIGVTGASSANTLAEEADVIIGVGTRFQDFTTGSWSLFKNPDRKLLAINVQAYDAMKHGALSVTGDALRTLERLTEMLGDYRGPELDPELRTSWFAAADKVTAAPAPDDNAMPTDMQVVGAVQRAAQDNTVVMGAAGTMPGELHKLFKANRPMSYHMEYDFSCMGYEIAGGIGIKMAEPDRDVIIMVGDGSYMMANSELATAAMMGIKLTLVITDNRGFGCINRLQMGTGGAEFNNLLDHAYHVNPSTIDFVAHAASMGAKSVKAASIAELEKALAEAREHEGGPFAIVIDTDPYPSTEAGGTWWEVGVPEVSTREEVREARAAFEANRKLQRAD
ncbi:MAG: 3D-(3,5/4)-trihydroxycyclohexane-1,2-dione acylhydrolase (decyclizing) [Pseudomonadota bacterium]